MVKPLTASEASSRLKLLMAEWWIKLQEKKYEEAAFISNDISAAATQLRRATYIELDKHLEEKRASAAPKV